MTDEEIIKALKCCSRKNCMDCPMRICTDGRCVHDLSRDALHLINDQQAEIESTKNKRAMVFKFSEEQMNEIKKQVLESVEFDVEGIKREAYEQLVNKIKATSPKALLKIIIALTNE